MTVRPVLAVLLAGLLAACSSADRGVETQGAAMFRLVKDQITLRQKSAVAKADKAALLTRAQLSGVTDPLMRARVEKTRQVTLLYIAQRNGASQVWFSPDKASVMMRAGLITQTRGLGHDVYSVAAPQMLAVLERRGTAGPATRTHRTMDGSNTITATAYSCTISDLGAESLVVLERTYPLVHYREDCASESDRFSNDYWRDASGVTRASRQRISAGFGYIFTERLID